MRTPNTPARVESLVLLLLPVAVLVVGFARWAGA